MYYKNIYFLGIGGIGMSALARYFAHEGRIVAGYDRTPSALTAELEAEGISITYKDREDTIPDAFQDPTHTLVVYTPALPSDHRQWTWFQKHNFEILKRSRMLGIVSEDKYVMAVAGTHGKTTTTTMTAWFNHVVSGGGSAFLGGISKNFQNNFVLGSGDRLAVEADEFDRSFLQLHPDVAVVTAADPDHLDIYGTPDAFREAFSTFISQVKPGGALILKSGVELDIQQQDFRLFRYAYNTPADFYAQNIRLTEGGCYHFDLVCPDRVIGDCVLGIPGRINVENAIAAAGALWVAGIVDEQKLCEAMTSFAGVKRRFDFYLNTPGCIYMDDYAHHPRELTAAITSFQAMFPEKRLTVVFQPHLYSRTRDFLKEFGEALSLADEVLLLPIYPARETPIKGVSSEALLEQIVVPTQIVEKDELLNVLKVRNPEALITFGAGDIDRFCRPIASMLCKLNGL